MYKDLPRTLAFALFFRSVSFILPFAFAASHSTLVDLRATFTMKASLQILALAVGHAVLGATLPANSSGPQFDKGQPIDGNGKGAPLLGRHFLQLYALGCVD
jgi:hypothetical protein